MIEQKEFARACGSGGKQHGNDADAVGYDDLFTFSDLDADSPSTLMLLELVDPDYRLMGVNQTRPDENVSMRSRLSSMMTPRTGHTPRGEGDGERDKAEDTLPRKRAFR